MVLKGLVDYKQLPSLARGANVLVMPYADRPVTRAMQPLKLKEYLATGKPVGLCDLPATRAWADCGDVVADAASFVQASLDRARTGTPAAQSKAR